MRKLSHESIKAIMAKHNVKTATPAQMSALLRFEAERNALAESRNNPPCVTCGDRIRTKIGNQCFKCKHYRKK